MVVVLACALALFPLLRRLLAVGSGAVPRLLDPALTGGVALAFVAVMFVVGVSTGDTGGEGGVLGILGVLKRDELDLRPVANAALLAAGAYLAQVALGRAPFRNPRGGRHATPLAAAGAAAVLVLTLGGLCARASSALGREALVARGIERHAPLGKISLALLRRASDADRDGYAARFGGGDCDDRDAKVSPNALDVPGNGVDEDCSGADTPAPAPEAPREEQAAEGETKKPKKTFNVILITVDTLRADLGFLGYDDRISPNLDKLAAASTVFEHAYSMASYTGKSVGPFLIGKYPSETARDWNHFNTYAPSNTFVAERVHAQGVRTFAGHCHWYFKFPTGLNQGMDVWDTSAIPPGMGDNDTSITSVREADLALKLLANPENTTPGAAVAQGGGADAGAGAGADAGPGGGADAGVAGVAGDAGVAGVAGVAALPSNAGAPDASAATVPTAPDDAASPRRFFGWFHFFDPHAQYVPHQGAPVFHGPLPARNLYDGEVWFTDQHIGRVLDYIASQPWGAETAIIVTADHGEAFADHGISWHGQEIWESLVHVPLIVHVPGAEPRRVHVKRSQIDLVPTILDLMGVPMPDEGELDGQSLLSDVYAPADAELPERDVYIDMPAGPYNGARRAVISGPTPGMKLIHQGGSTYLLFDLAKDPKEAHDLSGDKDELTPMVQKLQAIRSRLKEIDVKRTP
jgi:arylsulfatase A-like enzyme